MNLFYVKIVKAATAINYVIDHIQAQIVAINFNKEKKHKKLKLVIVPICSLIDCAILKYNFNNSLHQ